MHAQNHEIQRTLDALGSFFLIKSYINSKEVVLAAQKAIIFCAQVEMLKISSIHACHPLQTGPFPVYSEP